MANVDYRLKLAGVMRQTVAWVAWKLGEGDWQHYGPATKTVRPDVPRVIPPSWWKRYAQFLLARNQGNPKGAKT